MTTHANPGLPAQAVAADAASGVSRAAGRRWAVLLRLVELVGVVVLAGVVFAQFENPTQHIDELYHVLAAKSLLSDGDLLIGEAGEPYTRARGFTYTVALCFTLLGEGVWQSRLPSMLAGLVLIGTLFGWTRWRFGRLSAWLGALFVIWCPLVVFATELSRFYMVQAAAVALMLVAADGVLDVSLARSWRVSAALLGVVATAVALHVQPSSLFALACLLGGVVLCTLWRLGAGRARPVRWRVLVIGGVVLLGALAMLAGLRWVGPIQAQWAKYTGTVAWAEATRDETTYYLSYLRRMHHWPLYLLPIAGALACRRYGWRAAWVLSLFVVGLVAHSFGGMKAPRYLLWALPYFWLTLAIGGGALVGLLSPRPAAGASRAKLGVHMATAGAVVVLLSLSVARTSGFYQTKTMLTGGYHAFQYSDWPGVLPVLEADRAWDGGVVVASADNKAMDALGRCDYSLSVSRTEGRDEFALDWRTGQPVISEGASIERVVAEHPAGLVVVEQSHWREGWAVPDAVADRIESLAQPVVVDPALRLVVFRWDRRGALVEEERSADE
ncbi:MAG: ArnT family glycosyltransferase [Phycisphaerales bacterium JB063]